MACWNNHVCPLFIRLSLFIPEDGSLRPGLVGPGPELADGARGASRPSRRAPGPPAASGAARPAGPGAAPCAPRPATGTPAGRSRDQGRSTRRG